MRILAIGVGAFLLSAVLTGCDFGRHRLGELTGSRVFQVESGDRLFCTLRENLEVGHCWLGSCDDGDVDLKIFHRRGEGDGELPDLAEVELRVHRGYDGPTTVHLFSNAPAKDGELRDLYVMLYKGTGDRAFWR